MTAREQAASHSPRRPHQAKRDASGLTDKDRVCRAFLGARRAWQDAHMSPNDPRSHVAENMRDLWNETLAKARAEDNQPKVHYAKVRDLVKPYVDGTPNLEIHLPKETADGLPFRIDERVSIRLRVAGREYDDGLRATARHNHIRVCPDLRTLSRKRLALGRVHEG